MSELEELFHDYWNSDLRHIIHNRLFRTNDTFLVYDNEQFRNLQKHVADILEHDQFMYWREDPKTSLIIRHVFYIEHKYIFDNTKYAWTAFDNNRFFVKNLHGEIVTQPICPLSLTIPSQDTHGLVQDDITIYTLGIGIIADTHEKRDIAQNLYPAIEEFLAREHRLFEQFLDQDYFQRGMFIKVVVATYCLRIMYFSGLGQWRTYDKYGDIEHAGTLQQVCDKLFYR